MKERPILYAGAMVRALRADLKTMTRRVVKGAALDWLDREEFTPEFVALPENGMCPYGRPGDRLWVREAWKAHPTFDNLPPRDIPQSHVWYLADDGYKAESRTRASMHMPRWASRITLEIASVRVERLHDISEADARAEGPTPIPDPCDHVRLTCADIGCSGPQPYRTGFRALWRDINGPDSWDANPWVWVLEFRRLQEGGAA